MRRSERSIFIILFNCGLSGAVASGGNFMPEIELPNLPSKHSLHRKTNRSDWKFFLCFSISCNCSSSANLQRMTTIKTAQRCRCSCRWVPVVVIIVYWIIIWLDWWLSWRRRRRRQPCPLNSFRRLRWRRIRWRTAPRPIFRQNTLVNRTKSMSTVFVSTYYLWIFC